MRAPDSTIPAGFCQCGCGQLTRVPTRSSPSRGQAKGVPLMFVHGHNQRGNVTPLADRFWPKVDRSGGTDACWPWTGATKGKGKGNFRVSSDKTVIASRMAWELTWGPIPDGMEVCHRCDFPLCCNPYKCLFLGTHVENMADRDAKGRQAHGERSGKAVFPESTAREILRLAALGWRRDAIAARLDVSSDNVRNIVSGRRWKHLPR